jgi:hypothetical protein
MHGAEILEARREAHVEAILFVALAAALLVALAVVSLTEGWKLLGVTGWVWLVLCLPDVLLAIELWFSMDTTGHERQHHIVQVILGLMVVGNLAGLALLVAALLTEKTSQLAAGQLLMSGFVVWWSNVIVFGLWFWTLDCGGPVQRAQHGHDHPDFSFPQDADPELARRDEDGDPWHPRLEDYVYVALTNAIAFSPTDTMPLTRWAKTLMAVESAIAVVAILLVAARAVNVLGS